MRKVQIQTILLVQLAKYFTVLVKLVKIVLGNLRSDRYILLSLSQ